MWLTLHLTAIASITRTAITVEVSVLERTAAIVVAVVRTS